MQFADPQDLSTAYLILRHIYDGDVIEWPIGEDHPLAQIFAALETQGYIARWDRTWPRRDRYRLTEKGISTIEAVYRPAGAEVMWNDLRSKGLNPNERRAYLQSQGYDPTLWALLHDPSTHWDTYRTEGGRYTDYLWEDRRAMRRRRRGAVIATTTDDDYDDDGIPDYLDTDDERPLNPSPTTIDLDREAQDAGMDLSPSGADYDVS
jgi:hypothetical protein